ncbi:TadG family pilus assembly protein [Caballeronia ptereochthonis]|nr:TadG family pilus assembly protein [Caballeronia ptereochthonis]
MSIMMPFLLLIALMAGAVALDMGHLYLAQAELQTAADAAALAGAASLLSASSSGPNWSAAQAAAASAVSLNSSDGVTLHDASIQSGYWNLSGSPAGMQATTIVPGSYDAAAVQVTVSRAPGLNGGPVSYFLAPLFGMNNGPVSATSVAMVSAPGSIGAGGLFPVAIGTCIYSLYWNARTGTPKIDPSTGAAYEVSFGAGSNVRGCQSGQWTSFQTNANDVPTVRGFIASGNPTALNIGDSIWIEPGAKTTLYSDVSTKAGINGIDVILPVVNDASSASSSTQPIVAFAAFHIDKAHGGSGKYIQGHLLAGYKITTVGNGQVGPYYGAYVPPRLAR